MRIIYFSQFYTPESIAPSFRATDNSRIWADMGNEVTVFTGFPNYPKGEIFDGYKVERLKEEHIDGVRVLRSKLIAVPNTSISKRLKNALSFFWYGLLNINFHAKEVGTDYDVVLGTSGVIFTALLAWIYSAKNHLPFVFEIRDITYVQLQATGHKYKSFAVSVMKSLELFLCRKAKKVVVVTNGFKKILVSDGIPAEKIVVITNGVDVKQAEFDENNDKTILSYFGTLGVSQDIFSTFQYAKAISDYCDDFEYLIIGDGAQKEEIQEKAKSGKFPFVKMLPGMPADELEPYYGFTKWSVITLRKSDNFRYTIPSKLFQIMGRGIAVLFIGPDGETAEIIRKYNAGLALTGSVTEDLEELKRFCNKPDLEQRLIEMGQNGRKAVLDHYSRKKLAEQYINLMNGILR